MAPIEKGWSDEASQEQGAAHPSIDRRVTVVIPTRNRQRHLLVALRSALDQVGVDVRVLVADQASTDGTVDAIRRLDDPRVEIIRSERCLPPAGARNIGLARVDTPWVAFLDDDDIWAPDRLRSGLEVMYGSGADWCATGSVQFLDPSLRICGATSPPNPDTLWPEILGGNRIPGGGSGVLARTSLVRGVGGFREDMPRAEDWELWIRLARSGRLAVVDRPMVAYRLATSSRAHQASAATNRALQEWLRREYEDVMRQTGVFPDFLGIREYEAWMAAQAGRRWQASLDHLHLASKRRDLRHLVHAASTVLAPRLSAYRRDRRAMSRIDPEWVRQGRAIIEWAYSPAPRRQAAGGRSR